MSATQSDPLHALFLGPNAENQQLFEKLLLEFLRDHAYWRRNFHPEDGSTVPTSSQFHDVFLDMVAKTRRELGFLSADLKRAAPFFSPRYIGHMNSDLLIPGLVAQMMTILYNPNNVAEEGGPATVSREIEVGKQLAAMFGYNTNIDREPSAWGHLTSGGTIANYEALYNLREVKFFPIALQAAAREFGFKLPGPGGPARDLLSYSGWELVNLSVSQTVGLLHKANRFLAQADLEPQTVMAFWDCMDRHSLKHLGSVAFFQAFPEIKPPVVLGPATAHYSWEKALRLLGLGERQFMKIPINETMVVDLDHFQQVLEEVCEQKQPVLMAIGVLGTTEFSGVDPIGEMVAMRDQMHKRGLFFGLHVDAAWGGYLASLFRRPDGQLCEFEEVHADFKHFPSTHVYEAMRALPEVDSITIDPHKLGYLPYPSGAYICRDLGVIDFITQKVSYLYDLKEERQQKNQEARLRNLGQFILEGSKPGAAAAAAFVSHKVLPLHKHGFGKLVARTVQACEYFHMRILRLAANLKEDINLVIPIKPQTNILCFAFNPKKNRSLGLMNHFERQLFANIKIDYKKPLQVKEFIGSYTSLVKQKIPQKLASSIFEELGIDSATFSDQRTDVRASDHIFLFRHSLMSPWLLEKRDGLTVLDRYCTYLEHAIIKELKASEA